MSGGLKLTGSHSSFPATMARLTPLLPALFLSLLSVSPSTVSAQQPAAAPSPASGLFGAIEGDHYAAPGGLYRVKIPVLPQLGGSISDTENVVVFRDDYSTHASIGAFALDATQRWELSTTGREEYLTAFFALLVMPDFEKMFPGSQIETTRFDPEIPGGRGGSGETGSPGEAGATGAEGGGVFCFTLLPGGSMFGTPFAEVRAAGEGPPVARRGNLIFARNGVVYVLSTELPERMQRGRNYRKTPEEENALLTRQLEALLRAIQFPEAGSR